MKKYLQEYLQRIDNSLRLVMEPIMPRSYAMKLFDEGVLKSIRLVRYNIPEDDADRYGVNRGVEDMVEERVIRKPIGFLQNKKIQLQNFIGGKSSIDEVIKIAGFEIDDLKLEFKIGKKIKTISLKNIDSLITSEDVTDDVTIEKGHPTFHSLCIAMEETGKFYLEAKGALV